MIRALGILGSPRRGGNTDLLLEEALRGAAEEGVEVEKVVLDALDIRPCTACDGCRDGVRCALDDDMGALYGKVEEADIVILASPVYFDAVSAQAKAFIDRCQLFWFRKYVLKVKGKVRGSAFISVGARIRTDFSGPEATARALFYTLDAMPCQFLTFAGFEERGSIEDHPDALEQAKALGWKLATEARERKRL
ncbi:MAG: flavodoxin family protein [Methanomassiliicoccus sp.]|nr:flavodoxin family protein [Methanomassiliicoccus sp.]